MKLLRDVAIRHLLTVAPATSLRRVAQMMVERGVGSAVVVRAEAVVGIVTERDVLRAVAEDADLAATAVGAVMTTDVVSGAPGWDVVRAVRTMTERGFRHLLVVEMGEPLGIVSLRDLMDTMADMVQPVPSSD